MVIKACPKCGRKPKIEEGIPINGARRRICRCPNYCSVFPNFRLRVYDTSFIFVGEGDDNAILSIWNKCIDRYNLNTPKEWFERDFSPVDKRIG